MITLKKTHTFTSTSTHRLSTISFTVRRSQSPQGTAAEEQTPSCPAGGEAARPEIRKEHAGMSAGRNTAEGPVRSNGEHAQGKQPGACCEPWWARESPSRGRSPSSQRAACQSPRASPGTGRARLLRDAPRATRPGAGAGRPRRDT
eukprot:215350-Hanusia_phi.AAC.1